MISLITTLQLSLELTTLMVLSIDFANRINWELSAITECSLRKLVGASESNQIEC